MKNLLLISLLISNALLFIACESNQPLDLLKNKTHRSVIIDSFVNHQPYRMEMMSNMMQNDSCRFLIGQKMMEKPELMGMMMNDPKKMKRTIDHMVNMASKDSSMFNDMILIMKEKPEMWNKVMKMQTDTIKI